MILLRIDAGGDARLAALSDRIPEAAARAINRVLFAVRRGERDEMGRVFHKPTRYTLESVWVDKPTPSRLSGTVGFKTQAGRAVPPSKWMRPQVIGGGRQIKRFELRLGQGYAYPGPAAPLDAHDNIPAGEYTRIIQRLGNLAGMVPTRISASSRARLGKAGKLTRDGREYWVQRKGGQAVGVWRLLAPGKVGAVLIFGRAPTYRPRLDFWGIAQGIIDARLPPAIAQELG